MSSYPDNRTELNFLKALKSRDTAVPFIFFSESVGEKTVIEALNLGADYFLLKGEGSETEFAQLRNIVERFIVQPKVKGENSES